MGFLKMDFSDAINHLFQTYLDINLVVLKGDGYYAKEDREVALNLIEKGFREIDVIAKIPAITTITGDVQLVKPHALFFKETHLSDCPQECEPVFLDLVKPNHILLVWELKDKNSGRRFFIYKRLEKIIDLDIVVLPVK